MWAMLIKRILRGCLTVAAVIVLIFALLRVVPGDPVALLAGEDATPEHIAMVRSQWGLDQPILTQFLVYVKSLASGDAGMSYQYSTTNGIQTVRVTELVATRLPYTIQLAAFAIILSIVIAIPLGVLTALKPGSILDNCLMAVNFVVISFPAFFIGMILMAVLALSLKWLPAGGSGSWKYVILPALTLSMHFNVTLMRMTRTEVGRILNSDYIQMCRAKGLSHMRVLFVHGLRNASIPLITLIGLRFGAMLGGSVVIEALFRWPGIGNLLISAVQSRDYPTVQYLVPYVAVVFVFLNTAIDMLYGVLDPRIHREV